MTEHFEATSTEIACTLTPGDLEDTEAAWRKLLGTGPVSRELVPGGIRFTVPAESAPSLRRLVDIERICCAWIEFVINGPTVTMTAPGPGEAAIRAMWADTSTGS